MAFAGSGSFYPGELLRWAALRVFALFGLILVVVGLLVTPLPLPFGIPLILVGTLIVLNTSTSAKRSFLRWLRRHPAMLRRVRMILRRRSRRT